MKECRKCGVVSDDFSPDSRASDGLQSRCRACCREANNARRRADPELTRAKSREYYRKNRERVLATNEASRDRNRESILEGKRDYYLRVKDTPEYIQKTAEYRERNKRRKREYDREYRARTAEQQAQRSEEWRARNPQKRRAIVRQYRARRRMQEAGGVSTGALANWTEAMPKVCFYCGDGCADNFHVDHFVPLSKGGPHVLTNLRIACAPCNLSKSARDPMEWMDMIQPVMEEAA